MRESRGMGGRWERQAVGGRVAIGRKPGEEDRSGEEVRRKSPVGGALGRSWTQNKKPDMCNLEGTIRGDVAA